MLLEDAIERAAEVASRVLTPEAERIDREGAWPEAGLRALQDAGLGGLVLPREVGGHGHGLFAVGRVCEVLGRACPSTAISFGMHLVASAVIAAKATPAQRARYLEPIARGEHLTTLALSEPGSGSHFYIPETRIDRSAGGYTVTGTKSFVTNGAHADSYVVSVASDAGDHGVGEFSCVVVGRDTPGLTWGSEWRGWGMRGNAARSLQLDGSPIPRDDLIGEVGDQIWYVFHVVTPYFLMAMSGTYLGVAEAALEEGRQHLRSRHYSHAASTLAENPILQHRLGVLWGQVHRSRALVHEAGRMADGGAPDALLALCAAKAEVADAAVDVAGEVMTLLGGRAYGQSSRIQRLYRDARAAHIMAPTTDILRTWIGRSLLDLPLLGE